MGCEKINNLIYPRRHYSQLGTALSIKNKVGEALPGTGRGIPGKRYIYYILLSKPSWEGENALSEKSLCVDRMWKTRL